LAAAPVAWRYLVDHGYAIVHAERLVILLHRFRIGNAVNIPTYCHATPSRTETSTKMAAAMTRSIGWELFEDEIVWAVTRGCDTCRRSHPAL
jgi:hypothetical protein